MKLSSLKQLIRKVIEEQEKPGLWANIRAKRKRVGKKGMSKQNLYRKIYREFCH